MKVAVYPGSFNPWHEGHQDILNKALKVFDKVIVARGINPEKDKHGPLENYSHNERIVHVEFNSLLTDFINNYPEPITAVIRGLRNGQDFEFEKTQQYWNEDLGLLVPTVYFITDRKLTHMSSTAVRIIDSFKK